MSAGRNSSARATHWVWWLIFAVLIVYVATRLGAFAFSADVESPSGVVRLPNTFASVDHPFHVARAEMLWRELGSGHLLRWVSQHQGGYPVEFYPLGEAWLEVAVRALSLGTLSAEGAHTLSVIAIFLAPGIAFASLARLDGWSPAVGVLALVLHISLPGSWYHGGYTELVQWGLVTNVAAAVAAFLMLPALVRFLHAGEGWMGATAAFLAAGAIYCNPRSLLGLAALGAGAWLASAYLPLGRVGRTRHAKVAAAGDAGIAPTSDSVGGLEVRMAQVGVLAALLSAPELAALAR
ncbi:MAG: hypothetical protein ACRDJC_02595, partial [Thermomicrobiales bacterium]